MPGGRPSEYTREICDKICELLIDGKSLRAICRENDDMPHISTVCRWMAQNKEFSEQYARIKEEQAEVFADEIVSISDEAPAQIIDEKGVVRYDSAAVNWQRLRADSRKWVASKLKSKKYGEKLELGNIDDKPFQIAINKTYEK